MFLAATAKMERFELHLAGFLESLRVANYSPATIQSRRGSLVCFFKHLHQIGLIDLRQVSRQIVQAYQRSLMRRYPAGTVLVRLVALRRFFGHLESTDQILINPCRKMILPKQPDRLPRAVLSKAQARRILGLPDTRKSKGIRDRAMLELFYSSGLRLAEMTRLQLADLDLRQGFLRVNQGKGSKDRIVPIGKTASYWLVEYLKIRAEWLRKSRDPFQSALWLAPIVPHQPLQKAAVGSIVRRYGKSAHQWRHSFATHLVNGGASIAHVQRLLGHRSLATTQIYTRATLGEVRKTFRRTHPRERLRS